MRVLNVKLLFFRYLLHFTGIHPTTISDSFMRAASEAEKILDAMAVPVDLNDDEKLVKIATTSLNSKVFI